MKVFRDPVHDIISFDKQSEKLYIDLINTKEFQRLRHIRQLGLSLFTYTGAEHTRLAHSIGVAYLMKRFITHLGTLKQNHYQHIIDEITDQKDLAIVSALLHDVGHGPFSHAFENTTGEKHEKWTIRIILGQTEINEVLEGYKTGFAQEVANVIERTHPSSIIVKLLSSQLDTDRIDYLLRDSLMTGAKYGSFDLEWLINTLRIGEVNGFPEVGLDFDKGLSIAESFVLARYYMYKHVYFHKTTRCAELIVEKVFERIIELVYDDILVPMSDSLKIILNNDKPNTQNLSQQLEAFLRLNDHTIWYYIQEWTHHEDHILSDLANRLIIRDFYKSIEPIEDLKLLDIWGSIDKEQLNDFPLKYLLLKDDASSSSYKDSYIAQKKIVNESGQEFEATEQIFLFKGEEALELSSASEMINTIRNKKISIKKLYVPEYLKKIILEKL